MLSKQELREQRTKLWNNPRDTLSWYQCVAFSRWLNHRLNGLELVNSSNHEVLRVGENAEVRLPTEWEWQWAAQNGNEEREYPWGKLHYALANTSVSNLDCTIAVGMYPNGSAFCGALDMAGNLWEWCLNDYWNVKISDGYSNHQSKALRGGSFRDPQHLTRTSFRHSSDPVIRDNTYGFRLVVARHSADFDLIPV